MELLLVLVVLVSLGLAAFMSIVAWRLLADSRERSAARVAALEALASSPRDSDDVDDAPAGDVDAEADPSPAERARFHDDLGARAGLEPHADRGAGGGPSDDSEDDFDWHVRRDEPVDERIEDEIERDEPVDERFEDEIDLALRPATRQPAPPAPLEHRPAARVREHPAARRARPKAPALPEEMFVTAAAPPRPRRQGLAAALVAASVLATGTGVVYAVRYAPSLSELSRRASSPAPASAEPLELLSLRHSSDPTGAFTVTGLVENPVKGSSLTNIVAVVYLFDDEGQYFAGGRARIDAAVFRPGDQAGFVVTVPGAGLVSRYRVGFRLEDGGVVAHVDERKRLRRGTPGDPVNGVDRGPERAPATPHRVEG